MSLSPLHRAWRMLPPRARRAAVVRATAALAPRPDRAPPPVAVPAPVAPAPDSDVIEESTPPLPASQLPPAPPPSDALDAWMEQWAPPPGTAPDWEQTPPAVLGRPVEAP